MNIKIIASLMLAFSSTYALSGCSSVPGEHKHRYCAVAEIDDPAWVDNHREKGYLVTKFGVEHNRTAERDIHKLATSVLAQNLYSDVHSYTHSTWSHNETVTNVHLNVASNVQMEQVRVSYGVTNGCLVAWASVSPENARIALEKSHPINAEEHAAWQEIAESTRMADYRNHLEKYPRGLYAETARARIRVLRKENELRYIRQSDMSPPAKVLTQLLVHIFF